MEILSGLVALADRIDKGAQLAFVDLTIAQARQLERRVAVVADQVWIRALTRIESALLPHISYRVFKPEDRGAGGVVVAGAVVGEALEGGVVVPQADGDGAQPRELADAEGEAQAWALEDAAVDRGDAAPEREQGAQAQAGAGDHDAGEVGVEVERRAGEGGVAGPAAAGAAGEQLDGPQLGGVRAPAGEQARGGEEQPDLVGGAAERDGIGERLDRQADVTRNSAAILDDDRRRPARAIETRGDDFGIGGAFVDGAIPECEQAGRRLDQRWAVDEILFVGRGNGLGVDLQVATYRRLRDIDEIAYVRFASIYRDFRDLGEFARELEAMQGDGG